MMDKPLLGNWERIICALFLINLSIYKDEFIKIEEYIRPYVNEINVRPDLKKVFVYVCIFTIFINKGIPIAFFCKKIICR